MEAADEVMMAFVVTGEPKLEFVVVQEGDARDNLFPPPPASLRRLKVYSVTFTNFSVLVFWFKGSV